jgi:hypothetical protein
MSSDMEPLHIENRTHIVAAKIKMWFLLPLNEVARN